MINEDNKRFRNDYECSCGETWSDEWSCMCNDRCPKCNKEIEPSQSQELDPESGEEIGELVVWNE